MPEVNDPLCVRCGCCDTLWHTCESCDGEGMNGHDCGEDTCCCADPEDNQTCDICDGEGGWRMCLGKCNKDGKHEKQSVDSQPQ